MDSDSLVQPLDAFKNCRAHLAVHAELLAVDEFLLQGRPEAFHHGVVAAVAGAVHALRHAMLLEKFSTRIKRILHTMIAVIHNANQCRPALHDYRERIWRNRRMQRIRHGLPHNTSAPCVLYTREVQGARVSWNVGNVALKKIWRWSMRTLCSC